MRKDLKRRFDLLSKQIKFHYGRLMALPLTAPEHVYFGITNRCNLRCPMCDISRQPYEPDNELSTREVNAVIAQIRELGVVHLILSGGEPCLRPDLPEIIACVASQNIKMLDIITNGTLLTEELIKHCIRQRVNQITFSLDGIGGVNDSIRGNGVFAKAAENIDKINYYKKRSNSDLPGLGINFTIMNINIQDILPIIVFAQQKSCKMVVLQPILFSNIRMHEKQNSPLWPSEAQIIQLEKILNRVIALKSVPEGEIIATDLPLLEAIPAYFRRIASDHPVCCFEGIKRIVISHKGKLWSCRGEYGDLRAHRLKERWFSADARAIRKQALACTEHCLQDCVYLPAEPLAEAAAFLQHLESLGCAEQKYAARIRNMAAYYEWILRRGFSV